MFCHENNDLVIHLSAASSRYFEICSELMYLAARGNSARFENLKTQCQIRKDECADAKEALRLHRAAHGC